MLVPPPGLHTRPGILSCSALWDILAAYSREAERDRLCWVGHRCPFHRGLTPMLCSLLTLSPSASSIDYLGTASYL